MSNLAVVLKGQGELVRARALQEKSFEGYKNIFGENNIDTLRAMGNLAATVAEQNELGLARKLTECTLSGLQSLLDYRHASIRTYRENLICIFVRQGDYMALNALLEKHVTWHRLNLGESHPDTLLAVSQREKLLLLQHKAKPPATEPPLLAKLTRFWRGDN